MRYARSLLLALGLLGLGSNAQNAQSAAYKLVDNFSGSSFESGFDFFSQHDPTNGFVRYVSIVSKNPTHATRRRLGKGS
jgi:hypothetical protein